MAQTVSELWKTLWSTKNTRREYAFDIEGTWYGPEAEVEHKAESALYSDFGIGNASASSLSLNLFAENIPRGAQIKRYVRLVNGEQASEWLQHGLYWANRRGNDDGYWNIEAIDAMRKGDAEWVPDQSLEFPESGMPMTEAVEIIADLMGVELDPRTQINAAYTIDYPVSKQTLRKTLAWIAAAHGGNWVATGQWNEDTGRPYIRLVPLISAPVSTSYLVTEYGAPILIGGVRIRVGVAASGLGNNTGSKFYVGRNIVDFTDNGKYKPVSRVTLLLDDENSLTAGDDTGFEIVADCPYATQAMVDALLAQLRGYEYQSYEAGEANIDPSAELGDGVTVGGLYAVIGRIVDDGTGYPSLSAPGEAAVDDEYPGGGPMQQEFNRKIAETQSLISTTSEQILLKVEGTDGNGGLAGQVASVSTKVDNIKLSVSNGAESSTLKLMSGETELSSANIKITGMVTFDSLSGMPTGTTRINGGWIDADTLNVKAANISGTIVAKRLQGQQVFLNTNQLVQVGVDDYGMPIFDYAVAGAMIITGADTSDFAVEVGSNGATRLKALNGAVDISSQYAVFSSITGNLIQGEIGINLFGDPDYGAVAYIRGGHIASASDNSYSCGTPRNRWAVMYAGTGTIQTSDQNQKNSIETLSERYMMLLDLVEPKRFKMNDGTSGRYHVGFIAQEVEAAMASAGISSTEFGGFVKDKDKDGNDIYMLRYDEFVALNTRQIQLLKARVAELEARL